MSVLALKVGEKIRTKIREAGHFIYSYSGLAIGSDDIMVIIGTVIEKKQHPNPKYQGMQVQEWKYIIEIKRSGLRMVMDPQTVQNEFELIPKERAK